MTRLLAMTMNFEVYKKDHMQSWESILLLAMIMFNKKVNPSDDQQILAITR